MKAQKSLSAYLAVLTVGTALSFAAAPSAEAAPHDRMNSDNRCTATFNNLIGHANGEAEIVITRNNGRTVLATERFPNVSADGFVELSKRATHVDGVERFFDRALGWIPLIGSLFKEDAGLDIVKYGPQDRDILCNQAAAEQVAQARAIIERTRTSNILTAAATTLQENCAEADSCEVPAGQTTRIIIRKPDVEATPLPPVQYENVTVSVRRVIQIGMPCDCTNGELAAKRLLANLADQYEGQADVIFYENKNLSHPDANGNYYVRLAVGVVDIYPDGRVVNVVQPAIFTTVNGELQQGVPMNAGNLAKGATGIFNNGNINAFDYVSDAMKKPKPEVTVRRAIRTPSVAVGG